MFDFGYGELLIIGIAALIFIGPKELPGVLRALGQWMGKIRRMAGEFQNQFQEAMREAELADLKKEVDGMAAQAANYSNFDPLAEVRKEMDSAQRDIETSLADKPTSDASGNASAASEPSIPVPAAASADATTAETAPQQQASVPDSQAPPPAGNMAEAVKEPVTHGAGGSEPA